MFKRKSVIEVVPEEEYTDFSDRFNIKDVALVGATVGTASLATYVWTMPDPIATEPVQTAIEPMQSLSEPVNALMNPPSIPLNGDLIPVTNDVIQTGVIGDASLNMLAGVLDPLVQIMVAISFPIASVIMVGACFFFMLDNSERAWNMIFKAGLGYVLIQMSPLFLNILREVGKAV